MPPSRNSSAAQSGSIGGQGVKRRLRVRALFTGLCCCVQLTAYSAACLQVEVGEDGRIYADCLNPDNPHPLVDGTVAVHLGLITEEYRANSLFCAYKHCPWAAHNKKQKCGEKSQNKQNGRAKCQAFCTHPECRRGFHPLCHSIVHRLCEHVSLPESFFLPQNPKKKKA